MSQEGVQDNEQLAGTLFAMQETENDGRGISCVRQIADAWRRGDLAGARQIATIDDDKIRGYPQIRQWLEDNLFGPDIDSPLKQLERIKQWSDSEDP